MKEYSVLILASLLLTCFVASVFALTINVHPDGELYVHSQAYVTSLTGNKPMAFKVGLNYLSDGNRGADHTRARLEADFEYFSDHSITYIDARLVWSSLELSIGNYHDTRLANYELLLDVADEYGLEVGITFWTQPPYSGRNFALPSWVPSWNDLFTNNTYRNAWFAWVEHTRDILKLKPALAYWQTCNEPYIGSADRALLESFIRTTAQKLATTGHPVSCRFIAGWNPYEGYFSDETLMNDLDFLSLTVYNDPDSDAYNTPSRCYWSDIEESINDAHNAGKEAWIIEFGLNYDTYGPERQRAHFQKSLENRFKPYGADVASGWAWVSAGPLDYNIAHNTATPRPAFYELEYAAAGEPPPECFRDSDCAESQICVSGECVTSPPEPPPAQYYIVNVTHSKGGYTFPSTGSYLTLVGEEFRIRAHPRSNHSFTHWLHNGTIASTSLNYSVIEEYPFTHSLYALFTRDTPPPPDPPTEWSLTMTTNTGGNIAPAEGSHLINTLSTVATATADEEYSFTRWLWDGGTVYTDNPVTVTAAFNSYHTLEAFFTADSAPPSPDAPTIIPKLTLPAVTPSGLLKNVTRQLESAKPHSFNDVVKVLSGRKPRSLDDIMRLLEDAK